MDILNIVACVGGAYYIVLFNIALFGFDDTTLKKMVP